MAKPILYYVLVSSWTHAGMGFQVVAVTSEAHGQIYGRILDGHETITHRGLRDVLHRFPEGTTSEFALAATGRAKAAHEKLQPAIVAADRALRDLQRNQKFAVLDAAKGA